MKRKLSLLLAGIMVCSIGTFASAGNASTKVANTKTNAVVKKNTRTTAGTHVVKKAKPTLKEICSSFHITPTFPGCIASWDGEMCGADQQAINDGLQWLSNYLNIWCALVFFDAEP